MLNFHRGNFRQPTFMSFDITVDWAEQAVSNNVTQFQPNYGKKPGDSLILQDMVAHQCLQSARSGLS